MKKTENCIFKAAIKVFSDKGYSGATMDDIAECAGVAKGTLYYHFKSKEDMFRFAVTEGMNIISEQVKEAVTKEKNSIAKIKALCRVQLSLVYENRNFFKVLMSQLWGQELRQLELRKVVEEYIKYLEGYLKEGMDSGAIKKGETYFMAYTFFGTLCSTALYELINGNKTEINHVIENLFKYIFNGIAAENA
jgi:AcrR family transcriptional regulator